MEEKNSSQHLACPKVSRPKNEMGAGVGLSAGKSTKKKERNLRVGTPGSVLYFEYSLQPCLTLSTSCTQRTLKVFTVLSR